MCSLSNLRVNRGVEARENEIANIQLEEEQLSSSHTLTERSDCRVGGVSAAGDGPRRPPSPPSLSDQTGSFIKVVVQKQRRPEARLPTASSPANNIPYRTMDGGENNTVPAAVLLACPAFAALHQHTWDQKHPFIGSTKRSEALPHEAGDVGANLSRDKFKVEKKDKRSLWKNLRNTERQDSDFFDNGPDRIEVYHFERTSEYLCARDGIRITRVEHVARWLQRPANAFLAELLAVPRLLFSLPVAVLLQMERCILLGTRSAMTGCVQIASDLLLKPSLALVFNAIVQPPLVFAAQTGGALRDAMRPLTLILADALDPLSRLLSSLRFVHIERRCSCPHHV